MTKLEKVIKGLECCNMPNNHDDCPYDGAAHYNICTHQLLTDSIALLKERQWVSVKDRLPEESGWVMVCNKGYGYVSVVHYSSKWCEFNNFDCLLPQSEERRAKWSDITHWMPLPEPPKEGDGE